MKKLMALAMLACVTMFAAVQLTPTTIITNPSNNYIVTNYNTNDATDPAHHISLTMTETGSLWMHNDITQFNPNLFDLKDIIDMNAGKYGAILENGYRVNGTGGSAIFLYTDVTDPAGTKTEDISTPGYFVGNFEEGTTLHFWITSLPEENEYGDSLEEIAAGVNEDLMARYNPDYDWVGNNIMDFKFRTANGGGELGSEDWMFVFATGDVIEGQRVFNGQPLPGTLATLLLFGGLLGGYKKMKKSKKA